MPWTTTTVRAAGFTVTAQVWEDELVNNMLYLEQAAVATPVTSSVVVDVTTPATSQLIIALPATTYEAVPHALYFHCGGVQRTQVATTSPSIFLGLYDGGAGTPVEDVKQIQIHSTNVGTSDGDFRHEFTPSAASHTYQIRAYNNTADSWTILAGAGGSGVLGAITCSIERIPV